jgi:hypothetical protein
LVSLTIEAQRFAGLRGDALAEALCALVIIAARSYSGRDDEKS